MANYLNKKGKLTGGILSTGCLLFLIQGFGASAPALAEDTPDTMLGRIRNKVLAKVEALPEELSAAANKGKGNVGQRISNAVFERVSDAELFQAPIAGGQIGVRVGRRVFSNNDIEESFTVVDRIQVPASAPAVSIPVGTAFTTFNIGLSGSLDFTNVRVVKPSDRLYTEKLVEELFTAPDLAERKSRLEQSDWLKAVQDDLATAEPAAEPGEIFFEGPTRSDKPVFLLDSLRNARYGRLWNLISAPLRLPLRASWLSHLGDGELMTFAGNGTIEMGPSVGLSTQWAGASIDPLGLGAGIRAYLRGTFRITVQKLAENRARLKVTRHSEFGASGSVGSSSGVRIYDGYLLTGSAIGLKASTTVGRLHESLVPISFGADRAWGDTFELGFEYDLTDDRAIEAYEQAILGRLALSDELAHVLADQGSRASVKRAFSRTATEARRSKNVAVRLAVVEREGSGTYRVEDATITLPDGTNRVFKARTDVQFSRKFGAFLLEVREGVSFAIQTDWVKDQLDSSKLSTFGWIAEGSIRDSDATGYELNRYAQMIESLFGVPGVFPKLPLYLPLEAHDPATARQSADGNETMPSPTRYGEASFYFRIGLNEAQLRKLTSVDEERMWKYLEQGFERHEGMWTRHPSDRVMAWLGGWLVNIAGWGATLGDVDQRLGSRFFHAQSFHNRWKDLRAITPDTEENRRLFTRKLGEMYSDRVFSYELIKSTLLAIRDQGERDISFQINANSAAFPAIDLKAGSITEIERITQRYAQQTGYDQPAPGSRADLTLEVKGLGLKVLDQESFELRFNASRLPGMVLIKVDELSEVLRIHTTVRRLLIPNRGQFAAGDNVLLLRKEVDKGFRSNLANAFRSGKNYRVTVALLDGENAGPAQSVEFFLNPEAGVASPHEETR